MEFVGLIPASGLAKRLGDIPCSKEIYPFKRAGEGQLKVLSEGLLNCYKHSGISKVFFIVRKGKWDILEYYGSGENHNMDIAYLIMNQPFGVPFTLNQAYPFVKDKIVALGFPDMIIEPRDCFDQLKTKMKEDKTNLSLGLYRISSPEKWDMVELDDQRNVKNIFIKRKGLNLSYGWSLAVWGPEFTKYMHRIVAQLILDGFDGEFKAKDGVLREIYLGDICQSYIDEGNAVSSVIFEKGKCIDLGTVEDLEKYL